MSGDVERDRLELFTTALLKVDRAGAVEALDEAGTTPKAQLLEKLMVPALADLGEAWERGETSLSQIYLGGRICEELLQQYLPEGVSSPHRGAPKMALVALADQHRLGMRLVHSVLRINGFEVESYGAGVTVENLVDRVLADEIELLLVSTLMLPSALQVKRLRERLDAMGASVRIVVGGAPFRFDETLWKEVGADAMAKTASEVVDVIERVGG